MFDIYWDDDCVSGDFEDEEHAYKALEAILNTHDLRQFAGGADGPNSWGVYRAVDADGFPSYHVLSVRENTYKIS